MKRIITLALALILTLSSLTSVSAYAQVTNGSRGSDVETLQSYLNAVIDAGLEVDGKFGPATNKAVKQFQREYDLNKADGIAGEETWKALVEAYDSLQNGGNDDEEEDLRFKKVESKVITYSLKEDGDVYLTNNFQVKEFACHDGSDEILIDQQLVALLQDIRDHFGKAVTINSAYRTVTYNSTIKNAAPKSKHTLGQAADIVVSGVDPIDVANYCKSIGVHGVGYYTKEAGDFVHVDTRSGKYHWKAIKVNEKNETKTKLKDYTNKKAFD